MKNFKYWFISLLLLGNLALMSALAFHVVWSPAGLAFVPKAQLSLVDTFVNTRHWKPGDLPHHAALVQRLGDADQMNLIEHLFALPVARRANEAPAAHAAPPPAAPTRTMVLPPATRPTQLATPPQDPPKPKTIFDFGMP